MLEVLGPVEEEEEALVCCKRIKYVITTELGMEYQQPYCKPAPVFCTTVPISEFLHTISKLRLPTAWMGKKLLFLRMNGV